MTSIVSSSTRATSPARRKKLRTPAKEIADVLRRRTRCRATASAADGVTLAKPGGRRGADPARRAVGADQLREARLDRVVAPAQRVVIGVGDLGRVLGVVEPVVMRDRLGQRARARPGPRPRSARRPAAGSSDGAAARRSKRSCAAPGDQARRGGARLGGDRAARQHAGDLLAVAYRRRAPRRGSRVSRAARLLATRQ